MTTEPTDAEILDLWESFVGEPTEEIPLSNSDKLCFARAALRSWGQPSGAVDWIGASSHHLIQQPTQAAPPAGREPLTEVQIEAINTRTLGHQHFARAIEAEVRKQDDALMRQLSDALEWLHLGIGPARDPMRAITAARARLLDSDLSNLTERGAKAWAGVDAQKLREDGTT